MKDYINKTSSLNEFFDKYMKDKEAYEEQFYESLADYLRAIIIPLIKEKEYIDLEALEDLVQDIMVALIGKGIEDFKGENARFSTYCFAIAKNKVNTYLKKRNLTRMSNLDDVYELEVQGKYTVSSDEIYKDPQLVYIIQETRLEMLDLFEKYISYIMNCNEKPYRVVSVCFSLILFHKYHPVTTMLGSPNWAYNKLKEISVDEGAENFREELIDWLKNHRFMWGANQEIGRTELEDGVQVGEMIFGRYFTPKDFENWSVRMRNKVKKALIEKEVVCHERKASFELGL